MTLWQAKDEKLMLVDQLVTNESNQSVWVIVDVWRGLAVGAEVFSSEAGAQKRLDYLIENTNLNEDDVNIFEVKVDDLHLQR